MPKKLLTLKWKLEALYREIDRDPKVLEAKKLAEQERLPQIKALEKQIATIKASRKPPKPRWPENTPQDVLNDCKEYWSGTVEDRSFRIHLWNDKAIWTGYPAGGYTNNGGWNKTSARFILISRTKKQYCLGKRQAISLADLDGRVSLKQMQQILDEKTK